MPAATETLTKKDIDGYLLGKWERIHAKRDKDREVLTDFFAFMRYRQIPLEEAFTLEGLNEYKKYTPLTDVEVIIRRFSLFLYNEGKIKEAICLEKVNRVLPEIYEDYLVYAKKRKQTSTQRLRLIKRVLYAFYLYLTKENIQLTSLRIEHIDAFQAEFHKPFAANTRRSYRLLLCGFLFYLYHEKKITQRDLASLVVGPREYTRTKPPKFFRPQEIEKLLSSIKLSTAWHLRAYAFILLSYTLGLRPVEISRLRIDDIRFSKGELAVKERKNDNPFSLPIPEMTIKALAAYLVWARPENANRTLFLSCFYPYPPIKSITVVGDIRRCIREANLPGSAYWLRHTYAQNLLESGASFFEIKEMLGHDSIESSKIYLHIHTGLMRKVLFDEDL